MSITPPVPGAIVSFTTNGNAPSASSMTFFTPIPLSGDGARMTVTAFAAAPGMADSETVSATFTIGYSWIAFPDGGTSPFNVPTGVALDSSGRIYVADSANNRIVRFLWI